MTCWVTTHSIIGKAQEYGLDIDPATAVEEISLHEAQLVEIAKALAQGIGGKVKASRVIIRADLEKS